MNDLIDTHISYEMNQISILISLYFSTFENEGYTNSPTSFTNLNCLHTCVHAHIPTHKEYLTLGKQRESDLREGRKGERGAN